MAEDVVWQLEADPESVLAAFEEIDASAQEMSDAISSAVADMSDQIAVATTALSEMSQMYADAAASALASADADDTLASALSGVTSAATEAATATEATATASTQAAAAKNEDATATENLGTAATATAAETQTLGEAVQSAMGPLMMIGTVAALAGGKLVSMGLDGQKGEALLSGMAGASAQDIQALQVEAQKLGVSMSDAAAGFYQVASAGYSGSDGVTVFDNAMKLAEGGQARAADIMSALTGIMHAYNVSAQDSGSITDLMGEAILRGKQSAQDFAASIGPLAAAGHNVGLSFQQVVAAEATMTQINPHVMQDAQQLRFLFNATSLSIQATADNAKKLHLQFDEVHYKSLDLEGRLQYLAEIAGGTNTVAFKKLVGGAAGMSAALDLLSGKGKAFQDNLAAMSHASGATEHAFQSWESTIPAHLDKAGAALSVFATRLMDAIGPTVTPIIDAITTAITNFSNLVSTNLDAITPILIGLGGVIVGVVVVALVALVSAIGPVILAIAGFGVAMGALAALVGFKTSMIGNYFDQMRRSAEENTLHMKDASLQHTKEMQEGNIAHIREQEQVIEQQIERTQNAHTKQMLLMKLKALEHSREQAEGVIKNIQHEREGIQKQLDELNPAVQLKNLQRKDDTIGTTIEQTMRTIQGYAQMKQGIERELSQTKDVHKRHALEIQLNGITAAEKQKEGVLKQYEQQRSGIEKQMAGIHQAMSADQGNVLTKLVGIFNSVASAIQNGIGAAIKFLSPILHDVGVYMSQTFAPVWKQLVDLWNSELLPLFKQLWTAIQPLLPVLAGLAMIILGLVIGAITGLVKALAGLLSGVITVLGGVVRIVTGVFQIIGGLVRIFVDLVTLNFKDLGPALGQIWQGIVNIFAGAWEVIKGVFQAAFGVIWGFISGFVDGIIGFFTMLHDRLVGHSIIPDMVNAIISWFEMLPAKAMQWGSDLINNFINGIKNVAGNLKNTVSNVAGDIKHLLGFSKPDQGPLADFDKYGPDMIELFASGIEAHSGRLKQALSTVAGSIGATINPRGSLATSSPGTSSLGGSALAPILMQILAVLQQQQRGGGSSVGLPPSVTQNNNISLSGVSNLQQLSNQLNAIAGYSYEAGQRGGF